MPKNTQISQEQMPPQEDYEITVSISAFFHAVRNRFVRDVEEQIKAGENINRRGSGGMTAGHIAAYGGDWRMLKMLLENGLDLTIKDDPTIKGERGVTVPQIVEYNARKLERHPSGPAAKNKLIKMQEVLEDHFNKLAAQQEPQKREADLSSGQGVDDYAAKSVKTPRTPLREVSSNEDTKLKSAESLESGSDKSSSAQSGAPTVRLDASHSPRSL